MDARITIGDKIDLEKIETRLSADPEKKPEVYTSQVLDSAEGDSLFAAMPIKEGKLVPLSVGQEFNATFYTKAALLRSKVVVKGRYKKGSLYLVELVLLEDLEKVQRREYFRFECRLPIEYRILGEQELELVENGDAYNAEEWQLDWKNGIMLDISGGGIRFVSSVKESKGCLIQVRLTITVEENPEVIYLFARILRSEKSPNNPSIFDNRIKFWRLDKGRREKIIRFIFNQQRLDRSKKLGLE